MPKALPRILFPTALALLVVLVPGATAQQSQFEETTSVVLVEVPVTVTKGDEPLRDLTADNFEISDNGKKQKITSFDVVDLGFGELEGTIPMAARRHFLLLFDLAFSEPEAVMRAREIARGILDSLHPTDVVAVGSYSSVRGVISVLGFTGDRPQVELAIDSFGLPDLIERGDDPLGLMLGSRRQAEGGEWEAAAEQNVRDVLVRAHAAEQVTDEATRVRAFAKNMEGIANFFGKLEGRKHILFLSEGFDSRLLTGGDATPQQSQSREAGEIWNVDSQSTFGDTAVVNIMSGMEEAFRRNDCLLHAVDISGGQARRAARDETAKEAIERGYQADSLDTSGGGMNTDPGFPRRSNESGLVAISRSTGGSYFRNLAHLQEGFKELLEQNSLTYVLAFQPSSIELNGKPHKLKVKLRGAPRGAKLIHRRGYDAPQPFLERQPFERKVEAAELILSAENSGGVAIDVLAVPMPDAEDRPYVPILVEADGASLLVGQQGERASIELYVYAMDKDDQVVDYASQTLTFNAQAARERLSESGVKFWSYLDLPPGDYVARILVRNAETGEHGLRRVPVTVPAFDQAEAILLPPLFPEPSQKWLHARAKSERQDFPYPYMMGDQRFVPAARPVVPATGTTTICLTGVHLPDEDLEIDSQVLNVDGRAVEGAALKVQRDYPGSEIRSVVAQLETSDLKPGIYSLVTTARGASTQQSSAIRFVVN